ncbi:hypothetical protein [Yinghuangia seranimata]|uniref:hypothetical protein n=1 Tax=Yinghuangia seranimata TaxID=408067 RepID=UPI00248B18DE|nr:hypothetical protein [Yinghuangia seranimata]MDI2125550.1 hypothetical protein [Yinghuangia seranimata]
MVCLQCGKPIAAVNSGLASPARIWRGRPRRYCSDACRMRAYRGRRTERPAAPVRVDRERELARGAKDLAAELAAAVGAVRRTLPSERLSREARAEALADALPEARRAAALAAALLMLLEPDADGADSADGADDETGAGHRVEAEPHPPA